MKELIEEYINQNMNIFEGIEYIYKNNNTNELIVMFAGKIDKFICISWFLDDSKNYSYLFLCDKQEENYTDKRFTKILHDLCNKYNHVHFYGMSMGGVGALQHVNITNIKSILVLDCCPIAINQDEKMHYILQKINLQFTKNMHLKIVVSNNESDIKFFNILKNYLYKFYNYEIHRSENTQHLSYIPNKMEYLAWLNYLSNKNNSYITY